MATYTATLYFPTEEPRQLTAEEIAALNPQMFELNERLYLGVSLEPAGELLGMDEAEPLASHSFAALYGFTDFCDSEAINTHAAADVLRLFNLTGLYGPLLIIEEITGKPEPTQAEERDPYHYDGEEYWPTYGEARATRLGLY